MIAGTSDPVVRAHLEPQFREILDAIALFERFTLVPVEVPSTRIAFGLAEFFQEQGKSVHCVEPATDDEWRNLVVHIMQTPVSPDDVVIVVGADDSTTPGLHDGLWLLNQKRDVLVDRLPCVMLWCGSKAFFEATWSQAPDFWSIRDLGHRIQLPSDSQPPPIVAPARALRRTSSSAQPAETAKVRGLPDALDPSRNFLGPPRRFVYSRPVMARRPKIVLTNQVALPARTVRDVQAACNPNIDLIGNDLVKLREDLSSVRGGARMLRMEESIRDSAAGDYQIHLLSGHLGSGKSTELRWLTRSVQLEKNGKVIYPLFVEMDQYVDELDIQIPEFLTALIAAILEDVRVGPRLLPLDFVRRFWRDFQQWVKTVGLTLESDILLGLANIKATFRSSPGFQQSFREENHKHIKHLVDTLSDLVENAREGLIEDGTHDLIIIVDKLDRIERLPLGDNTGRTRHDLFYLEQLKYVQKVPVHFVLTVPVTLHFTQNRLGQAFSRLNSVILPMVSVRERGTNRPNEAGIAALSRLLGRRVDLAETFADDDAREFAIESSGGCLRDLFRLVSEAALNKRALKLTRDDIDIIVQENANNYERLLQGRRFLRDLHYVAKTGSFPENFDDETKQWLLYHLVVVEYNGRTWYDVHPFAKRTRAFSDAAP